MPDIQWFSARVRLVCLMEGSGADRFQDSVIVFRARDFRDAFQRALTIGHDREETYLNGHGERVAWKFKEVFSLDIIQGELDGTEVYSEPVELGPGDPDPFDVVVYAPGRSEPTQTI